jgi:hypothetical protein
MLTKYTTMSILKNITMFLMVAVAVIQFGCKGKQGEVGPTGPNDPNAGLTSNGSFVKGTVTTSLTDNTPVSFSFNNTYLLFAPEYAGAGNAATLVAVRDFKGIVGGTSKYMLAEIALDLDSISDTNPANPRLLVYDEVAAIGNNQYFDFTLDQGGFTAVPVTLTNYQYNDATNTASGNFSVTSSFTANGKSATVTGSFSMVGLSETVYRQAAR